MPAAQTLAGECAGSAGPAPAVAPGLATAPGPAADPVAPGTRRLPVGKLWLYVDVGTTWADQPNPRPPSPSGLPDMWESAAGLGEVYGGLRGESSGRDGGGYSRRGLQGVPDAAPMGSYRGRGRAPEASLRRLAATGSYRGLAGLESAPGLDCR